MTEDMPRKLPPYVYSERSRHGKVVFYFRRGKGKRTRLPSILDPKFEAEYHAALSAQTPQKSPTANNKTLAWLITRYRDSSAYRALSKATIRQRDNIFKGVVAKAGGQPYRAVTRRRSLPSPRWLYGPCSGKATC